MKKKDVINIIILLIILTVGWYLYQNRKHSISKTQFGMDTIIEITAVGRDADRVEKAIDEAFELIEMYERKFSYYREDSELWKLNHTEQISHQIDEEFYQILELAYDFFLQTDSLYDVTIGNLIDLWDIDRQSIPTAQQIEAAKQTQGMEKIEFDLNRLNKPQDMKIHLGSIAKGYVIDRVVELLKEREIFAGVVNAGGDIYIFGYGNPLRVGIQHPRSQKNEIIGVLSINDMAVVTSGDYERYFEIDSERYHHIIDPHTGYPAKPTVAVTALAPQAIYADVLSTALFVMQPQEAIKLVDSIQDAEAIIHFQNENGIKYLMSEGLEKYMEELYEESD